MTSSLLLRASVESKLADFLKQYMGIDPRRTLSGVPFLELHGDFDSLIMFEVAAMIEDEYGLVLEFGEQVGLSAVPLNVHELADMVLALDAKRGQSLSALNTSTVADSESGA